ncbi:MAG: MGMT family protein [Opitutales bacterium]|nr:MGMT family protein [Opitutales bacterium]
MKMNKPAFVSFVEAPKAFQTWQFRIPEAPYPFVATMAPDSISSLNPSLEADSDKPIPSPENAPPLLQHLKHWLSSYYRGCPTVSDWILSPSGTPFQLAVWRALTSIPRGATASYRDIAEQIGEPKACRAVGNAIGRNPLMILIPCHRIVRSNGQTGGFRWGPALKRELLMLEETTGHPERPFR